MADRNVCPTARCLRGAHFFDFEIANRGEQSADLGLVVRPLDVPLRFHVLVVELLAVELLLACHEAGGLRFDIRVTPFGPGI